MILTSMAESKASIIRNIWSPPSSWKVPGSWFWWFWLFFIHDKDTPKTGKCRQLMILWSIKKDGRISCNSLDIRIPKQLEKNGDGRWKLNGAAAAWYYDGKTMNEDFILETSAMELDGKGLSLKAPGITPSSFSLEGDVFKTRLRGKDASGQTMDFEFRAKQEDKHDAVGPTHGNTPLPLGMRVEGTMIERFTLSGTEECGGKKSPISGTAYFQKILVAVPPPQWYWGIYHFNDGSILTYMVSYAGRAALADNLWKAPKLRKPTLPVKQDIMLYHAPSGRVFKGTDAVVMPKNEGGHLWSHTVIGKGRGFRLEAFAKAYSHACWSFGKRVGPLPAKSTFKYNEYPSVLERAVLETEDGERIELENGWGNMENSWGFLL
jgi:hypothetical protein